MKNKPESVIDYKKYPSPRMRHHTAPNLYLPVITTAFDPVYYPPTPKSLDWSCVYGNGKPPAALDIGCGRGMFLLEYALNNPNENILGIELRKHASDWLQTIITGEKIQNAAVLWYSIVNGLSFIASESIESVFYFFPDPWVKKRHLKRRAFTVKFLEEIHRVLRTGGILYLMTDVSEVHEYQLETLDEYGGFDFKTSVGSWSLPKTDQEKFCLLKNIPYVRTIGKKWKNNNEV